MSCIRTDRLSQTTETPVFSSVLCTQSCTEHLLIGSMNPHLIPFLCAPNLSRLIAYRKKTELRQNRRFPSIYQWGDKWWSFDEEKKVCQPLVTTMLRHTVPKIKKDKIFTLFDIVNQKCDPFFHREIQLISCFMLHYLI